MTLIRRHRHPHHLALGKRENVFQCTCLEKKGPCAGARYGVNLAGGACVPTCKLQYGQQSEGFLGNIQGNQMVNQYNDRSPEGLRPPATSLHVVRSDAGGGVRRSGS